MNASSAERPLHGLVIILALIVLTLVALSGLAAPATAGDGSLLSLEFNQAVFEAGDIAVLSVHGTPGDVPVLFASPSAGPTKVGKLGFIDVGVDPVLFIVELIPLPGTGSYELVCELDCLNPLLQQPFHLQAAVMDGSTGEFLGFSNPLVFQAVGGDCGLCVDKADTDPALGGSTGGHALWLPGIGTDFVFVSGGQLMERSDGTALLTGVVARESDPTQRFAVDIAFADAVFPGDVDHPPVGSPKLELDPSAYLDEGGQIDTRDWHYYETVVGALVGKDAFDGGVLTVERAGPAFQVGFGANGKNGSFGGSGWLTATTVAQPAGEPFPQAFQGDLNVDLGGDCVDCASEAGDHALTIKKLAPDLLFIEGGDFVEYADGTAKLSGVVEKVGEPGQRWTVDIAFTERKNPGAVDHPPTGSPKLELPSGSYVEQGGVIDPSTWHYYRATDGTLTGLDDVEGAVLSVQDDGPAFQVGLGANGKNELYGASGWLTVEVISEPILGPLPDDIENGDINIDLDGDCP